jgi:death-on-curing protein
MPIAFLSLAEVLEIHQDQIVRYGGEPGTRDLGLLQSALAMPEATFGGRFLHTDLFEMAAAYLFHLVQNHPFIDGNKRVGAVAAIVFLDLNGTEFDAPAGSLYDLVIALAQGERSKADAAVFLKEHSKRGQAAAPPTRRGRDRFRL